MLKKSHVAVMLAALLGTSAYCAAAPIVIGSRIEPLVDTFLIGRLDGATHQLTEPCRKEIVITHDQPWEGNVSSYHVIFKDGDIFRMYYRGAHLPNGKGTIRGHREVLCYAESKDGIKWTKPTLGLYDFQGSKDNNIVWNGVEAHAFAPFKDPNPACPPEQRYKALAMLPKSEGLRAFQSADGINWKPMRDEPVVRKSSPPNITEFDSLNLAFWDSERKCYVGYFRKYRPLDKKVADLPSIVRDIVTATSSDFMNWSESQWLQYPGATDNELYTNNIVQYERAPHIYIGLPSRYIPARMSRVPIAPKGHPWMNGINDTLFMSSRDGTTFNRSPEAYLRPGQASNGWVTRNTFPAWGIIETMSDHADPVPELSIYFTENYFNSAADSLRRATIRVDGFGSVRAGAKGGEMLTKPLIFDGKSLVINYATSAAGSVGVEIRRADGTPIPGFTLSDCDVIFGDDLERVVKWKGVQDLSALASKPVQLRFVLNDANLYAIQFK